MNIIMMEGKLDSSSKLDSWKTRPQRDEDINISTLSGNVTKTEPVIESVNPKNRNRTGTGKKPVTKNT
jgi:hypothetical protein